MSLFLFSECILTFFLVSLQDPNTQQEIMDFAKQGCDSFEDYKAQCIEYIDMYGPMVFGIAISYLQPVPFCTRLGYCTPTAT